ncbi:MAG: DUF1700 domain-containing protein [Clostridiales bacterium]|jgi:uncharacterized membrane protein|nr:DUF1700 domain-containing protein [Clostridiales bacterium]
MNKEQYLGALKKALCANRVEDIDDIISEYDEHFARKLSDGYPEEEIAARLEKPEIIARQFVIEPGADPHRRRGANVFIKTGVIFLDIILFVLDVVLFAFIAVFGAAAAGLTAAGACVAASGGFFPMPVMPAAARILVGVSALGLSGLVAVGTIYYALFVTQINRAYFRWHRGVMTGRISPPLSTAPRLGGKLKRRLRSVALISLLVFIAAIVAAFVLMNISAGAFEFWHVWHWFE